MEKNEKKESMGSPFGNIIALKDVRDKTTRKGSLRPLFDCVEAINSAVDSLQAFNESSPDDEDLRIVSKFLETLTSMQIKLLEMSREKIQKQNVLQRPMMDKYEKVPAPEEVGRPAL